MTDLTWNESPLWAASKLADGGFQEVNSSAHSEAARRVTLYGFREGFEIVLGDSCGGVPHAGLGRVLVAAGDSVPRHLKIKQEQRPNQEERSSAEEDGALEGRRSEQVYTNALEDNRLIIKACFGFLLWVGIAAFVVSALWSLFIDVSGPAMMATSLFTWVMLMIAKALGLDNSS